MTEIDLTCTPSTMGWTCEVTARNGRETHHRVHVTCADPSRPAPAASDPEALVRASLDFLLERESPESILREFDLSAIGQYFPDYEREIGQRLPG